MIFPLVSKLFLIQIKIRIKDKNINKKWINQSIHQSFSQTVDNVNDLWQSLLCSFDTKMAWLTAQDFRIQKN